GTSDKFRGMFRAINREGEKFASSVAYFPNILGDALKANFHRNVDGLEFAATLGIEVSDDSPVGYAYTLDLPYTEESENALDKLSERLALPAPAEIKALPKKGKKA
ncbi:MAG: hypothetical protein ACRDFB_00695, partial [Rhabdochlamydiaceae bacterium]